MKTVGHYEILEKLGEGGMGIVYKARDLRLGRFVAVKVLSPGKLPGAAHRERLFREAKIASALNHPNIVTIHDIECADGTDLIAMEYVTGKPLIDLIPEGGLPLKHALNYALQIADGAEKAHAAGVIHRDLKPANIMVNEQGLVKILDFGLAKRGESSSPSSEISATQTLPEPGLIKGTVAYMSPEQAVGEQVDARSDVFSFGVMLYEMISGKRPFLGKTAISTLRKIQIEPARPLREERVEVPEVLDRIVAKALSKEPQDRYPSMSAMRTDLRAALAEIDPAGQSPGRARSRWSTAIAIAAFVALIVTAELPSVRRTLFQESASPTAAPASAFDWVKQGRTYLQRYDRPENIDRAASAFQKAIQMDPAYAPAYAGLGEAYFRKDAATPDPQWKRLAADSARKSVELNPDLAVTHLVQGIVLLRAGKPDEAALDLRRAQELDPLNGTVCIWLGEYYSAIKDPARAEQFYTKATQLSPSDWNVYQYPGRFLFRNARYREAAQAWEQADRLAPDNIQVLRSLAAAYHALDRDDESWTVMQRALDIAPSATAYNNMGTFRFFQGRYAESASLFEKAVELNPNDYLYWGNLGDAHRWIPGNEARTKEAYLRATQLAQEKLLSQKGDPELQGSLALYLAKIGDKKRALEQVGELEKIAKRTPGSYFKSLAVYEITGNREKALRDLNEALRLGYPLKDINNEPELTSLRADRRYHAAVSNASGK